MNTAKDFVANPCMVVVLNDPFKANNPDINTLVIFAYGQVKKPIKVYDGYDAWHFHWRAKCMWNPDTPSYTEGVRWFSLDPVQLWAGF